MVRDFARINLKGVKGMKLKVMRVISLLLAVMLFTFCIPVVAYASDGSGSSGESGYDQYIQFYYTFENVDGTSVINEVSGKSNATLGSAATIIEDSERGGKVLNLPGGGANAGSWLSLPNDLFANVNGNDGFTFTMWLKVPAVSGDSFNRVFCASPYPLGSTNSGNANWTDPEFAIVRGEATNLPYNMRLFSGIAANGAAIDGVDILFSREFEVNKWQRLIVTMKKDDFAVYLNGVKIADLNSRIQSRAGFDDTIADSIQRFFESDYLSSLVNVALGRGLYTSDGNLRGQIDDFIFYNKFFSEEEIAEIYKGEFVAVLESIVSEAKLITEGECSQEIYIALQGAISEAEELLSDPDASGVQIKNIIEKLQDIMGNITSPAEIEVDLADRSLGEIYHGASASLYALSEPNVPDINTLIPIKPSHVIQKAPNGIQHPSGDALRVAEYFFEAGGKEVQIYMQDYYQRWYYPLRTPEEYIEEAVKVIAEDVKKFKEEWGAKNPGQNPDEKIIYVPFNEPENWNTRYPSFNSNNSTGMTSRQRFNEDWLKVYRAIKEIDPGARIAGPNLASYLNLVIENFLHFSVENDCLPDTISWHLLSNRSYNNARSNVGVYRTVESVAAQLFEQLYPDRESPFPLPIDINEYASQAEIAVGGSLLQYLARYDELKITGALPYWNTANSFGSLLAGQNEPNGAWWLYKWYADMEGDMAQINVIKAKDDRDAYGYGLYGLSTIDDDRKQVNLLFGGTTGRSKIVFNNITGHADSPSFFAGAEKVHISVWYSGYTGLTGFAVEPTQIIDNDFDIINGKVAFSVETDYNAVYYAVVTEAVDSTPKATWFKRYEAEDAEERINVQNPRNVYPISSNSSRSASNGRYIGGIEYPDSVVKFTVTVPVDGNYRLDIVEGSGSTAQLPAQSGQGTASQRQNSEYFVKIDDQPSFKIVLRADYSYEQLGMVTQYIDLAAGTHTIAISKYNQDTGEAGQGTATLDCIELTYKGEMGAKPNYRVQAEFSEYDVDKGLRRGSATPGFEGAGYITGYNSSSNANTRFVLCVPEDGMYDVKFRIATTSAGTLSVDHDRKNAIITDIPDTNGEWQDYSVKMFLRTGINLIDVKSTAELNLDYIDATFSSNDTVFSIEAEDCTVFGEPAENDPPLIREDVFAKYASGGKYVNGITSYDGQERYLEITIPNVEKAGRYKLVVRYANGEYSGSHSYNNNVVERYAQISVNGGEPETHHFKNTISWQQFATQTIDVYLKEGTNTIRFSNDNSYDGGSNPYGGNNASGTAGFTYHTCIEKGYTPAFDKFDIYPVVIADADITAKPFIITPVGGLVKEGGIKATANISLNPEAEAHSGTEAVVFQLMNGDMPVSIIALEKDITTTEQMTALFNVDPEAGDYTVEVYVFDKFDNSNQSAPIILADRIIIQ